MTSSISISQEERHGKVDIIVCAVIASIANKFVVGDELPKVPYRTIVDMYIDICFFLIMVSMGSVFLVHYFQAEYFHPAEHHEVVHEITNSTEHHARRLSGAVAAVEYTHEGEMLAWLVNWCLLGGSFGVYLLFHIWLIFQVSSVNQDIALWLDYDVRSHGAAKRIKNYFLRESHFLDVGGHKVHHFMLTERSMPAIEDMPVTPDFVHTQSQSKLLPPLHVDKIKSKYSTIVETIDALPVSDQADGADTMDRDSPFPAGTTEIKSTSVSSNRVSAFS